MEILTWAVGALLLLGASSFSIFLQRNWTTNLPKVNWSLPIVGETAQFWKQGAQKFLYEHFIRYGEFFSISILGRKIVVVNSPEACKFVLSTGHTNFVTNYQKHMSRLASEDRMLGTGHPHFRKIVHSATTGKNLQSRLPFISSLAEKTLESWASMGIVNTCDESRKFTFAVMLHIMWRDVEAFSPEMEQLMAAMATIEKGMVALPINLPGFTYYKALQARQSIVDQLTKVITQRRKDGMAMGDALDCLINLDDFKVSDYDICCVMMTYLFSGYATTAAILPWVVKLLHDHPDVRQRVQDEQEHFQAHMNEAKPLKSSMPFTSQVVDETLRLHSSVSFLPRRTITNVEYNGFVLPKDTMVWASITSIHLNQKNYPDPLNFDPSRFEDAPKPNTFMPFGNGIRSCPGSELARSEMLLLVHHLVTKYRWNRVGPEQGKPQDSLSPKLVGGFPIRLQRLPTATHALA